MISAHLPAGTKIVCVQFKQRDTFFGIKLDVGAVYTLRAYAVHPQSGQIGVYVEEVENILHSGFGMELGYGLAIFDALQSKSLPASILECLNARPKRVNKRQRENA